MGVAVVCVMDEHGKCSDTKQDSYSCDCPCHLFDPGTYRSRDQLDAEIALALAKERGTQESCQM